MADGKTLPGEETYCHRSIVRQHSGKLKDFAGQQHSIRESVDVAMGPVSQI